MDSSWVATQCRRAKRSKAKLLDLSNLDMPRWSPDIFGLCELETLKLNDNMLSDVPGELSNLENLLMLDLSNNNIVKLPNIDFEKMSSLCSIRLDGNPIAKDLSAATLRQLAQPEREDGKSQAQVLRELFRGISNQTKNPSSAVAPRKKSERELFREISNQSGHLDGIAHSAKVTASVGKPFAPELSQEKKSEGKSFAEYMQDLGESEDEYSDDFHDSEEDSAKKASKQLATANRPGKNETCVTAFGKIDPVDKISSDSREIRQPLDRAAPKERTSIPKVSSDKSSGRSSDISNPKVSSDKSSRRTSDKHHEDKDGEVMRLRAQVKELQAQVASSKRPSEKANLANTLPSRLHMLEDDDGADKLKQQLQEEQRRAKRLERDNQKLQDRMRESSMSNSSSNSAPHVELSEIQEGEILSKSGGFSIIYKGTWHGTPVAIKKLFDPSNSPENLAELDNEVSKLGKLRHPNILSLLAVHRKPPTYSIILEIVSGGSLFQLLHSKHSFNFAPGIESTVPVEPLIQINKFVALALSFMHARNVVHRDVKSHNVLLSPHLETKLCDFGLARMKSELMTGAMQFAGTPQYMAPELLRQQKYCEKVDSWAYGVLLWESMVVDIPFANLDVPEIRELATSGKMLAMPPEAPRPIQAVIKSCWTLDQGTRPSMSGVLDQVRSFLN